MRPATTNETSHALATVVPIGRHPSVFPVGVEARHGELGWVLVEQAKGNERLVRWYAFRDVPEAEFSERFDDEGNPVIEEQQITAHREWVSLCSLRRIVDPDRQRPDGWARLKRFGALHLPIGRIEHYVRPPGAADLPAWAVAGRAK